ncbi:putative basic amino acid antiporter YfcC [Kordiimonas gwangyangensis]|uniref:putative basic amino acid antiporter YfcC n=1 Tax=Kordiimonas gwangyangensis TaxID=288022 RepID=UPI0006851CBA|nr:putative basic amino acid antiporter YfcC [Kordiimonas gwangyangensis]
MAGHLNHSASSPDTSAKSLDTLVILFVLALLAYGAGFVVAPGYFDTPEGASLAVDQYRVADDAKGGMPLFSAGEETGFLNFLFEGLVSGTRNGATIGLMAFLLIVGGAFAMIMRTGAVEALLGHFIRADRTPSAMLVPGLFLSFSLCGAIFGMGEEAIVFTLVLVPALSKAGYDAITAVLVTYVATQVGFATSWMNPFSLVIAQGIAGVPALSGMEYRIAVWGVFTLFGCAFTYRYGQSLLRKHGQVAVTTDTTDTTALSPSLNRSQIMILAIVAAGLVWVMWGVVAEGYYLPEIATQFLAMALASALVSLLSRTDGMTASDFAAAFRDGAAQMAPAVIVIAFAKGIVYLLGGDDAGVPTY